MLSSYCRSYGCYWDSATRAIWIVRSLAAGLQDPESSLIRKKSGSLKAGLFPAGDVAAVGILRQGQPGPRFVWRALPRQGHWQARDGAQTISAIPSRMFMCDWPCRALPMPMLSEKVCTFDNSQGTRQPAASSTMCIHKGHLRHDVRVYGWCAVLSETMELLRAGGHLPVPAGYCSWDGLPALPGCPSW